MKKQGKQPIKQIYQRTTKKKQQQQQIIYIYIYIYIIYI